MAMKITAKQRKLAMQLVAEIREYCAAHANPENASKFSRYFKEGYDAWGIIGDRQELWVQKEPEWIERYQDLNLSGFLFLGNLLFASGKYEEGALAIRFVSKRLSDFSLASLQGIEVWFDVGIGNWAHTDVLCKLILEPLLAEGRITLDALEPWRESRLAYQRRAVPVAMLGLLKGSNSAEATRFVGFLRPLMMDGQRVVQQGVGWFLRETWKRHPLVAEAVLLEWKDSAPRTIIQYATEKMAPEQRIRYRKAKMWP